MLDAPSIYFLQFTFNLHLIFNDKIKTSHSKNHQLNHKALSSYTKRARSEIKLLAALLM